ncbi:MAG: D-alanyl-D-alanine carboxypeptidase/D-alanyl-D-alanine-endopeptidase [Bacteroidales bacterium]|nr:D-alanyl-D-alanine carboxypeptidase/D-alanyl-D-alanine-endopeptidase [Bacteroidales bacterium]
MNKVYVFILLVLFNFSLLSQVALKNQNHVVNLELKRLQDDPDLAYGSIGFYAIDVNTGEVIAELNPDLGLKSASTMKVITSAAALEVLSPTYKFETQLQYDGYIDTATNTLHGNIYIKGGADPTLGSKYFTSTKYKQFLKEWVYVIKSYGIDTINGRIIADATIYTWDITPPTWSWEDMSNYFGAGACGLTIYDDLYTLYFNTSSTIGGKTYITKVEPEIPGMTIDNTVTAANTTSDNSYIYGAPYTFHRYIRGELPLARTDFKVKGAMPDPALFAAMELHNTLVSEGIPVSDTPSTIRILDDDKFNTSNRQKIFSTFSPALSDIIYQLNMHSINLFAEHLLIHVGLTRTGVNDTKSASDAMESFWASKGMDIRGMSINDGSGLSYYNSVSAKQLVFVLNYMFNTSNYYQTFYNSLPVSGVSGTLKSVCVNTVAYSKIHAKSGSIRKVRCYAGYTTSNSGREIAFAMMLNNFTCSDYNSKNKLEKLMIALVSLNE